MRFIATKNLNKSEDKHPDFRLHMRGADDEMVTEEYTNKDGETKEAWKSFGAVWLNRGEDGAVKSMTVVVDEDNDGDGAPIEGPTEEDEMKAEDLDF